LSLANITGGVVGTAFGVALLWASYTGPVVFIRNVFAREIEEDPDAPLVHLLLNLAGNIGVDLLVAAGIVFIGVNLLVIGLNLRNIHYIVGRPSVAQRME